MIVVAGPASPDLAPKIAEKLDAKLLRLDHKLFPDGESYIRFTESIDGEKVLVVQGTHPPQDRHILQACLIADAARELGAREVNLVAPYLAYARQDRRFLEGEAVSVKTVLKLLASAGFNRIYTVNIHSPWVAEESPIPLIDVKAEPALAQHLRRLGLGKPLIVSVGKKGVEMARRVAEAFGTEYAAAQSARDRVTGEVRVEVGKVAAETVVAVDDIISTGGTMSRLIKALKKQGVKKVYAACVHALLIGDAEEKIASAGAEKIIASDTVSNKFTEYSVAGILAEALRRE